MGEFMSEGKKTMQRKQPGQRKQHGRQREMGAPSLCAKQGTCTAAALHNSPEKLQHNTHTLPMQGKKECLCHEHHAFDRFH